MTDHQVGDAAQGDATGAAIIDLSWLELARIWRECQVVLEASLPRPSFQTWLARSALIGQDGSNFTIAVPTPVARDFVAKLSTHVLDALTAVTGVNRPVVNLLVDADRFSDSDGDEVDDDHPTVVQVEVVRAPGDGGPMGRGRMENNLSRKAVFALQGRRGEQIGRVEVRDVVGKVTRTYTLGQLGALEMDVCVWLIGQWTPANRGRISFAARECARGLGVSWNGDFGLAMKDAIRRMKAMSITGKVYDASTKRYREHGFSIIDDYKIDEKRETMEEEGTKGTSKIAVVLGDFLVSQLELGQYSDLDMGVYRSGALRMPKARRLYQFLECEDGEEEGTVVRVGINECLAESMGSSDYRLNPSRFRRRLLSYGTAISQATGGLYERFEVHQGLGPNSWELVVRRSPRWRALRDQERTIFRSRHGRALDEALVARREQATA